MSKHWMQVADVDAFIAADVAAALGLRVKAAGG